MALVPMEFDNTAITTATGTYTTAAWATGSNTCTWTAPSAGTYLIWMRFQYSGSGNWTRYSQFQMKGTATRYFSSDGLDFFWNGDENSRSYRNIVEISAPIMATAGQTIIPYIHTDTANAPFSVNIIGLKVA